MYKKQFNIIEVKLKKKKIIQNKIELNRIK